MNLRSGEQVITVVGGKCAVCRKPIAAGKAVQLSSRTNAIRHEECLPKSDSRYRGRSAGVENSDD